MSNPLLVGLDVHRTLNAVCVMDRQGQELVPRLVVDNNRPGTQQLVQRLAQLMPEGDLDALHVGAEATGWDWFHLFLSLSQDPALSPWPLSLYPTNPRLTAHFKKTYGDLDHTDVIDAVVVADRLRWGRDLSAPFPYDDTYGPLRFLTRYRSHVVHTLARETAYCLAILYLKASEYTRPDTQPFSDVFGVASRAVLKEFASIEAIVTLPFDHRVEFIDQSGKRRFADPADNARRLQQVSENSYRLPPTLQPPINLILGLSLQHIIALEGQQKRLEAALAERIAAIPPTLDTIPGIDPVFAGGILSESASIERFKGDQAKVAKFAGLKWRRHQSADFQAEDTPLARTGNRYRRYYFCEAANAVRMRDPDYAAYYDRKYHEVRKHQHKRAIGLTARKLIRLVLRLLTTNQPYQPRRR
jgi:transposase